MGGKRLARHLRYRDAAAVGTPGDRCRQFIGKCDSGAFHTCILASRRLLPFDSPRADGHEGQEPPEGRVLEKGVVKE